MESLVRTNERLLLQNDSFIDVSIKRFVIDFFGKLIISYFLAIRKGIKFSNTVDDLVLFSLFEEIVEKGFESVESIEFKAKREIAEVFSKRFKDISRRKIDLINKGIKLFNDFIEKNLDNILSYKNLESLKKEIYKNNDFLQQFLKFFKEKALYKFLDSYLEEVDISTSEKKYIGKFFNSQKNILFERLKAKAETMGVYFYNFDKDKEVVYFGRDFIFGNKSKKYSLFLGYLLMMIDTFGSSILVSIDLDDFKWINTLFGHSIGDVVIGNFMRRMNDFFVQNDGLWVKYGGEEFLGLLKDKESFFNFVNNFGENLYMCLDINGGMEGTLIYNILKNIDWQQKDFKFVEYQKGDISLKIHIKEEGGGLKKFKIIDLKKGSLIAWDLIAKVDNGNLKEIYLKTSFTWAGRKVCKSEIKNLIKHSKVDFNEFSRWIQNLSIKMTNLKIKKKSWWTKQRGCGRK